MKTLNTVICAAAALALATTTNAGDAKQDMAETQMGTAIHQLGDLKLSAPYARATLPNQPVAGAFLTVANTGTGDDILVSVAASFAARAEIHEMAMDGDTMKMRKLADGLIIPAGETVDLKPGGYHLMFMDLNGPLVAGEMVQIELTFATAGSITVPFHVAEIGAKAMDHADHKQGS